MSNFQPMQDACEFAGGVTALAQQLGVSHQQIRKWVVGEQAIPIVRCVQLEELTGGQITRKQLRPEDWYEIWPELRGTD